MGNEAWDKAVEAVAEQLWPLPEWEGLRTLAKEAADEVLRAAFPILAEELLLHAEAAWVDHGGSRVILTALRARIEQMKERE